MLIMLHPKSYYYNHSMKTNYYLFGFLFLFLFSCLTVVYLGRTIHKLKLQEKALRVEYQDISNRYEILKNLFSGTLSFFEDIDDSLLYNDLVQLFPSSIKKNCFFVLVSRKGCSSCLSFLLNKLVELDTTKDNYYFVLEDNNTFLKDELKASGYFNYTIDNSLVKNIPFPNGIGIIIVKSNNRRLSYSGYDIHLDNILLNHFINH